MGAIYVLTNLKAWTNCKVILNFFLIVFPSYFCSTRTMRIDGIVFCPIESLAGSPPPLHYTSSNSPLRRRSPQRRRRPLPVCRRRRHHPHLLHAAAAAAVRVPTPCSGIPPPLCASSAQSLESTRLVVANRSVSPPSAVRRHPPAASRRSTAPYSRFPPRSCSPVRCSMKCRHQGFFLVEPLPREPERWAGHSLLSAVVHGRDWYMAAAGGQRRKARSSRTPTCRGLGGSGSGSRT